MHFRSFSFRRKEKKTSPEREALAEVSPPDPLFARHEKLLPTSIANIVLDPDNLTALYRGASTSTSAAEPVPAAQNSSSNGVDTLQVPSSASESESGSFSVPSPSPESPNKSAPHHHPKTSIGDLIVNPVTLSALYEARDAERHNAVARKDDSST